MRAVVQRVSGSSVVVDGETVGRIDRGLLVLLGVTHDDSIADIHYLADKIVALRIFDDAEGKANLSLNDVGGELLVVSQFTLYADTSRGRRPSFINAARGEVAERLYEEFLSYARTITPRVEHGVFGAMMDVSLVNDGPFTILIDSKSR